MAQEKVSEVGATEAEKEESTGSNLKGLLITVVIVALIAFRLWAKFGNRE